VADSGPRRVAMVPKQQDASYSSQSIYELLNKFAVINILSSQEAFPFQEISVMPQARHICWSIPRTNLVRYLQVSNRMTVASVLSITPTEDGVKLEYILLPSLKTILAQGTAHRLALIQRS